MSKKRNDPSKLKQRRDRIRRAKHAQKPGPPPGPPLGHLFAAERAMREVRALLEGQKFGGVEEINARLAELTSGGNMSRMAQAWKQDDPKWQAQELAYEAMETDDPLEALQLVAESQRLDKNCTDSQRLMIALLPMELENRIQLLREAVEKAERNFGEEFFSKTVGHFWGDVYTRPYMRTMQHLAECLTEADRLDEAILAYERMLELNPHDNQGVRYILLGLYLATGQTKGAGDLFSHYPNEGEFSATFAWGRVLERWLCGQLAEAESALAQARKVNPYTELYISGARKLPSEIPEYYRPGDVSEGQVSANELRAAWTRFPDFSEWLRAHK